MAPAVAGLEGEAEKAAYPRAGGSETGGAQAIAGLGTKRCSNICPAPPSVLWDKQGEQPLLSHEC